MKLFIPFYVYIYICNYIIKSACKQKDWASDGNQWQGVVKSQVPLWDRTWLMTMSWP